MKKSTFTQTVKDEICENDFTNLQYLSVLSAFIMINASFSTEDERKILLSTENAKIAKLIFKALKQTFSVTPIFTYSKKMKLDKCVVYHITIKEKIDEIMTYLELIDDEGYEVYPYNIISEVDELRAFIAGLFLASGSVNSPTSDNYHLQITVNSEETAKYIVKQLNRFRNEKSMDFKYVKSRNKYIVYLKKADQIANFLAVVYANESMMDFENERIQKDFINSDNRYQICLNANYQKTIAKSNEQIKDIEMIEKHFSMCYLSEKEQLIAKARKEYNEAPLSELSLILKKEYGITISKSGLSRAFNNIHDLARKVNK